MNQKRGLFLLLSFFIHFDMNSHLQGFVRRIFLIFVVLYPFDSSNLLLAFGIYVLRLTSEPRML